MLLVFTLQTPTKKCLIYTLLIVCKNCYLLTIFIYYWLPICKLDCAEAVTQRSEVNGSTRPTADSYHMKVGGNLRPVSVFRFTEKPTHLATALTAESRLIFDVWYCTYFEIGRTTWLM